MPERAARHASPDGLKITRLTATPDALGESPVWDDVAGCLWWIDSVAGVIRRLDLTTVRMEDFTIGGHVGAIALATANCLIACRGHDFLLYDTVSRRIEPILRLQDANPAMRLNDGKLDRQGRLLCAGMGRAGDPLGALHQLDGAGQHRVLATGLRIGNGVCFSPAGDVLYFADTPQRKVFACDYNPETGTVSLPRLHIDTVALGSGVDGATVDREGNLWAAMIRSGEIACFSPEGRIRYRIPAPVDLPSSVAFGGPDLITLFVTSIRDSGSGRAISSHLEGGHLYSIEGTGAAGIAEKRFELTRQSREQNKND